MTVAPIWQRVEPPPVEAARFGVPVTSSTLQALAAGAGHLMCARGRRCASHLRQHEWYEVMFSHWGLLGVMPDSDAENFSFLVPLSDRARHLLVAVEYQHNPEAPASDPFIQVALRDPALSVTHDSVRWARTTGTLPGSRIGALALGLLAQSVCPRLWAVTPWPVSSNTAAERAASPIIVPGSVRGTVAAIHVTSLAARVWSVHVWERFEEEVPAAP